MSARSHAAAGWPAKHEVMGVGVSATTYAEATAAIMAAARAGTPAIATALPVHGVVTASRDAELGRQVNSFELVAPDGQPVRWALNAVHGARLRDRVYGPELMLRLCAAAAGEGMGIYLYGSEPKVVADLKERLVARFPELRVVGCESPPFRPLDVEEDREVVGRINASGARLVFLGLGCPRQDEFAFAHRSSLKAVQICVGAAFDFHSGNKRMAPGWMQRRGLEWLFRLLEEPGRLWRRYLFTNTAFAAWFGAEVLRSRLRALRGG
jgi:N-acetylglucosaminyldiphosphoundecaprenol N-acetyl-beta-D-mannosaminyltransferase